MNRFLVGTLKQRKKKFC